MTSRVMSRGWLWALLVLGLASAAHQARGAPLDAPHGLSVGVSLWIAEVFAESALYPYGVEEACEAHLLRERAQHLPWDVPTIRLRPAAAEQHAACVTVRRPTSGQLTVADGVSRVTLRWDQRCDNADTDAPWILIDERSAEPYLWRDVVAIPLSLATMLKGVQTGDGGPCDQGSNRLTATVTYDEVLVDGQNVMQTVERTVDKTILFRHERIKFRSRQVLRRLFNAPKELR